MKRLAIFLPNWIGDVVMATPAIRSLRQQFADAQILVVAKPYVSETLSGSPWFDELIPWDRKGPNHHRFWEVRRRLADGPLDAAVLFPNSFRPALLAKLAGAREIVGFARYLRDPLLTKRLYAKRDHRGGFKPMPVIDDYNRIVEKLGVPNPGHRMELHTTAMDDALAERVWGKLGLESATQVIGINPGGAFGSSKHWPTEHFIELAGQLSRIPGTSVLILCGPSEREIARSIVTQSKHARIVSLADEPLSIGLTKAIVKRLTLLVTTDSGPRHFAAAFNRPVVSLFGPTHIGWTETYFPKAIHLQIPVPCGPCQLRVCPLDHRCMKELKPAMVLDAVLKLLRDRRMDSLHAERRNAS